MPGTALRRKLLWLIGGRAGVITLLLGSAILIQLKAPGSFPIDPFFALIGLTYALTVVWTLTLPFVDRHPWLIDVHEARKKAAAEGKPLFVYSGGGASGSAARPVARNSPRLSTAMSSPPPVSLAVTLAMSPS